MDDDSALLGWSHMVSPTNENANTQESSIFSSPLLGNVHKLPQHLHASSKMAPTLCSIIRGVLEAKQVQAQSIQI